MRRTTMLWEVFVRRFEEAFEQYKRHRLTGEEAGELLGMSGRNFRRLCIRYEDDGIAGLRDRRIGKVSPRRAPERELERMHELYRERYSDFTVKHFHDYALTPRRTMGARSHRGSRACSSSINPGADQVAQLSLRSWSRLTTFSWTPP